MVEDLYSYELMQTYNMMQQGKQLTRWQSIKERRELILLIVCQGIIFSAVLAYIATLDIKLKTTNWISIMLTRYCCIWIIYITLKSDMIGFF